MEKIDIQILELYDSGLKYSEISKRLGIWSSHVRRTCINNGRYVQLTNYQKDVRRLREQGFCCIEIASTLGKTTESVRATANKIGMPFSDEDKAKSKEIQRARLVSKGKDHERLCRIVLDNCPGFEYYGNYTGSAGRADIICTECHTIGNYSWISIRHGDVACPACRKSIADEKAKIKAEEKEKRKESYELARKERAEQKAKERESKKRTVICIECGKSFETYKTNQVCCSSECTKHRLNRNSDRRLKKYGQKENGITLARLYEKDKGVCYICGTICDWNDKEERNGTIICGDNYPSIEHIIPLSKGGTNEWGNVALACRRCNTIKRDDVGDFYKAFFNRCI